MFMIDTKIKLNFLITRYLGRRAIFNSLNDRKLFSEGFIFCGGMPGYRGTIGPQWLVERIENTDNTTNQKTTTENTDNAMQLVLLKIPTILLLLLKIPTSLSIAATLLSLNTQLLTGSFSKYRQHYPLQLVTDALIIHRHSIVEMCVQINCHMKV